MGVKVVRRVGRPSHMQRLIEDSLVGTGKDFIKWLEANNRVASGRSKNWTVSLKRYGNNKPKDIQGDLTGVGYANYAFFGRRATGKGPRVEDILTWMRQRGLSAKDFGMRRDRDAAYVIAFNIGVGGTKAKRMGVRVQDAIYSKNLDKAIKKHVPLIAAETADKLIDGFIEAIGDVKNIQVTSS